MVAPLLDGYETYTAYMPKDNQIVRQDLLFGGAPNIRKLFEKVTIKVVLRGNVGDSLEGALSAGCAEVVCAAG